MSNCSELILNCPIIRIFSFFTEKNESAHYIWRKISKRNDPYRDVKILIFRRFDIFFFVLLAKMNEVKYADIVKKKKEMAILFLSNSKIDFKVCCIWETELNQKVSYIDSNIAVGWKPKTFSFHFLLPYIISFSLTFFTKLKISNKRISTSLKNKMHLIF